MLNANLTCYELMNWTLVTYLELISSPNLHFLRRFDQRDAHEVPDDFENDDEPHEEDHHFGASRRNDQPFGDNFVQVSSQLTLILA